MDHVLFSAIFVDRDGVINRAVLKEYVWERERFVFLPGAVEGLKALRPLCRKLIVVTNQSGIGQGFYSEDQYRALRDWYHAELLAQGVGFDAEYFCPHHPTLGLGAYRLVCDCRKPRPGMVREAARAHGIDLARSCMIGDTASDMQMAKTAGCLAVHVATGLESMAPLVADHHFPSLPEAATYLGRNIT